MATRNPLGGPFTGPEQHRRHIFAQDFDNAGAYMAMSALRGIEMRDGGEPTLSREEARDINAWRLTWKG